MCDLFNNISVSFCLILRNFRFDSCSLKWNEINLWITLILNREYNFSNFVSYWYEFIACSPYAVNVLSSCYNWVEYYEIITSTNSSFLHFCRAFSLLWVSFDSWIYTSDLGTSLIWFATGSWGGWDWFVDFSNSVPTPVVFNGERVLRTKL